MNNFIALSTGILTGSIAMWLLGVVEIKDVILNTASPMILGVGVGIWSIKK